MIMRLTRIVSRMIYNRHKFIRKFSCPAIQMPEDFPIENNIRFILDHGYVCPICKDTGIVPCKMCKNGCVFCGYSKFIICKCRLDFT